MEWMIANLCYTTWEICVGNILIMWDNYSWWYYTNEIISTLISC